MKILILSKRQYTNLDLIDDKFGRIRELPMSLARLGHKVTGVCLSYRPRKEGLYEDLQEDACVKWYSLNVIRLISFGAKSYYRTLNRILKEEKPDLIWASSDALHIILGAWIADQYKIPFIADLYDNYETFKFTWLTGGKKLFRYVLKYSNGITCVSRPLANYIYSTISFQGPIEVIENAVPKGGFYPLNKLDCRRRLGLPEKGFYLGTAGAISNSRGIDVLFGAFEGLLKRGFDIRLALAGPCDKGLRIPQKNRIHYLGVLPPENVSVFLSALDIQVICNKNSAFGRYCFPQKFYEAIACKVPLVAAGVGAMQEKLEQYPDHLFEPENVMDLESVLHRRMQNQNPFSLPIEAATWDMRGKRMEKFFRTYKRAFQKDLTRCKTSLY